MPLHQSGRAGHMHKGHVHKVLQQRMQDAHPCSGNLLDAIKRDFGSMEQLQSKLSAESAAVQVRVHGVIVTVPVCIPGPSGWPCVWLH